jgi:hypothetical protein
MNEPRTLPTPEPDLSGVLDLGATLNEHDRWLRRVVASRLGEPQAVDKVMQDVALAAVAQRLPLLNPARAAVCFYRLAVRQVLIYRRKSGRQRSLVDRYAARKDVREIDAAPSPLVEHEKPDATQVGRLDLAVTKRASVMWPGPIAPEIKPPRSALYETLPSPRGLDRACFLCGELRRPARFRARVSLDRAGPANRRES